MARALDVISCLLIIAAGLAFTFGVQALGERRDLAALYLLVVGGLCLKAATDLLRPKSGDA
ncbi:MAG TPA: hypothetical protein VJN18_05800 [Polyangiaceae bacterium]|nr:hypothetical protein [Polyangiaceae bacterium]